MPSPGAVTFDNILDDLEGILQTLQNAGNLSYGTLQEQLSWKPSLHLINYIRFLEQQGWVVYDRISDDLTLTDVGTGALDDVDGWSDLAHESFASHLTPPADSTDPEQDALGYDDEDDDLATSMLSADDVDGVLDMTAAVEFVDEDEPLDEGLSGSTNAEDAEVVEPEEDVFEPEPEPEPAPEPEPEPEPAPQAPAPTTTPSRNSGAYTSARSAARPEASKSDQGRKPMSTSSYRSASSGSTSEGLYSREEELGSGGIGTVYRGLQTRLARPVAIKEIRNIFHVFADVQRDDIIRRFVEIVQTQASLDHPNIIQVYDVISDSDYPYVVTQYAPRGNLRRLIDTEGRPALNVAMSYFMQILHALNSAHEQGIVHGGLKPENVVLDPAGNALLTDFGMTQVVERASGGGGNQVYVGVGTVAYMSPEQFMDPNLASVQSDIYSLGIMFYEMLTGKVPGRRSPMPSSFYPDIPRKLDDIFDKMSMDDREDRFTNVRDILREVYAAEDVMDIMDKRSGVLFLRDPTVFGELGMNEGGSASDPVESSSDYGSYAVENSYEDYSAPASHDDLVPADEADSIEEPFEMPEEHAGEVEAADAQDAADDAAGAEDNAEVEDDSGVLDKLDKYGSLFDDEDED